VALKHLGSEFTPRIFVVSEADKADAWVIIFNGSFARPTYR